MTDRYLILERSKSGHCCFLYTVMDGSKPEMIGGKHYECSKGKHYEAVCECFEKEEAELVAAALNEREELKAAELLATKAMTYLAGKLSMMNGKFSYEWIQEALTEVAKV